MANEEELTAKEEFEVAMSIETLDGAEFFIKKRLKYMRETLGIEGAKEILLDRLGYMAGYYDEKARAKMENLFGAKHPILGSLRPFPEESLLLGEITARTDMKTARRVADALNRRSGGIS